jgi:hypothetical protein
MRRRVVARLVPERVPEQKPVEVPDFAAVSQRILGDRIFSDDLMESEREGSRF